MAPGNPEVAERAIRGRDVERGQVRPAGEPSLLAGLRLLQILSDQYMPAGIVIGYRAEDAMQNCFHFSANWVTASGSHHFPSLISRGAAMDEYQIMSLLMRLEMRDADPTTVATLYAQTLAEVSPQLTEDQLRRLLLCGAYICHGRDRNAGGPEAYSCATSSGRSSIELPSDEPHLY